MDIVEGIGCFVAVSAMIYLKYRQQKWVNDQRDHKADVATLFDGEK